MAQAGRKFFTFILILVASFLAITLVAHDSVTDTHKLAFGGTGNTTYYDLSATPEGLVWAIGRDGSDYKLSVGTLNGCEWSGKLNDKILPEYFTVEDIYAVSDESALLTGYTTDANGAVDSYQLYHIIGKGDKLNLLLSLDSTGGAASQGGSSAGFSAFSGNGDNIRFIFDEGDKSTVYELSAANMSVRSLRSVAISGWNDALMLHDGVIIFARSGGIISVFSTVGIHEYDLEVSGNAAELWDGGDGFYFLDDSANMLCEVGETSDGYYLAGKIPVESGLSIAVQPGGIAWWLENGRLYRYDGIVNEQEGVLYPSVWRSRAYMAAGAAALIVFSLILTAILCGKRQVSMLLRGLLVMIFALVITAGLRYRQMIPLLQSSVQENAQMTVESIADMGVMLAPETNGQENTEDTAARAGKALRESGLYDTKVTLYRYAANGYTVVSTTDGDMNTGATVVGSSFLLNAKQDGVSSRTRETLNGTVCEAVAAQGNYLFYVQANVERLMQDAKDNVGPFTDIMAISQAVFCLAVLAILLKIWGGVKRITAGMDLVSSGEYDVELIHHSGDELESLANAMNHMARTLKNSEDKAQIIDTNYMRFVPEDTIKLLGVERLEDVTRETVATNEMVLMTVSFELQQEGMTTEQLFSDINEIIERTVFAAVAYGGNSFNFSHGSYNIVFDKDYESMAFMAAVAIEGAVDSINKEREVKSLPPVLLRVAMDRGLVRLGIVGDELHMVPVVVSACAEKNSRMLEIAETLDARITFTDALLDSVGDHFYRYVGNFAASDGEERLYELFEGDAYLVSQRKKDTRSEFAQAMNAFYRRDFTETKRVLLLLARTGSGRDGAVRYYLNIADQYEQSAPKNLLLNEE